MHSLTWSFYSESQKLKKSQLKIDGFNKTFDYFREKRKVGDWMVVRELIVVQDGFLKQSRNNGFFEYRAELTCNEREVGSAGDGRKKDRCMLFKKPCWNRIRIGLLVSTVMDFRFRNWSERNGMKMVQVSPLSRTLPFFP